MPSPLPPNVHVSSHPCLRAKLSQLRSHATSSRDTNALVSEITTLLGCEALAGTLDVVEDGTDTTALGYTYPVSRISPGNIALVPILRSGLAMLSSIQALLPSPCPIHHLGLFREPTTLEPVEYYNNLPTSTSTSTSSSSTSSRDKPIHTAILLDPIIATGGTAAAAIQTLKECGAKKVVMVSVLGTREGVARAASEWEGGVEIWVGAVDEGVDGKGMIVPGMGDVGDRLFLALGK